MKLPNKIISILFTGIFFLLSSLVRGQQNSDLQWYEAEDMLIQGKFESTAKDPFIRFPGKMMAKVRGRVWQLSRNSSGLYLDFQTDALSIYVKYQVEDELAFPHMPATGVSGLDLYASEVKNEWRRVVGNYSFNDTITYQFSGIQPAINSQLRSFRLYLPLYNTVKWLRIGVPARSTLNGQESIGDKPIVVYGTSIVQGACASRPGMAWTSILGRKLGRSVINLGFSGNGRLEPEIIDYMSEANASVYILDCMANFTSGQGLNAAAANKRLIQSVKDLRVKRPEIPIILVEHAGYYDGVIQPNKHAIYYELNKAVKEAFAYLKKINVKYIFLLQNEELNLGPESFVDGTHPNDQGMLQYAEALTQKIVKIEN